MNVRSRWSFVAVACTVLAGPASALDRVTEYQAAVKIYFAGSSALDNLIQATLISLSGGICDAALGDVDVWRTDTQRVITCRVSNENTPSHGFAPRANGGTMIAFHRDDTGASAAGYLSLISVAKGQAHSARWLNVGGLSNDCVDVVVAATTQTQAYRDHSGCATVLTAADSAASATFDVHGGVTAIEPLLGHPSAGMDEARLLTYPTVDIVLGVPATTTLYRALQKAQFGVGSTCDGSDVFNCVPSLTRAQLRALYSQSVVDWSGFKVNAVALTASAGVPPPADNFVRICRRVAASGIQAAFEAYFLKERCVAGVPGFAAPDDASTIDDIVYSPPDFVGGSLVNAGPRPADVRTCLASANSGNFWALGVMSTDIPDASYMNGNAGFRFVAIDGAAPNLTNTANGDYDFFVHATVHRISNTYPGNIGALMDGDPRREVYELLQERLVRLNRLAGLAGSPKPWGRGGLLAPAGTPSSNTAPYSDVEMSTSPVNTMARDFNMCKPALMFNETTVNGIPNP